MHSDQGKVLIVAMCKPISVAIICNQHIEWAVRASIDPGQSFSSNFSISMLECFEYQFTSCAFVFLLGLERWCGLIRQRLHHSHLFQASYRQLRGQDPLQWLDDQASGGPALPRRESSFHPDWLQVKTANGVLVGVISLMCTLGAVFHF